jgi:two-component system chemotaxis response regulator CheY
MRALVADDSLSMRRVIQSFLKATGIDDVDQAVDGIEALVLGKKNAYDVILLDWNMPNMTGIDVLRRFRTSGVAAPVIMVTTEVDRQKVREAAELGAAGYLIKPFDKETLIARVRHALTHAR